MGASAPPFLRLMKAIGKAASRMLSSGGSG